MYTIEAVEGLSVCFGFCFLFLDSSCSSDLTGRQH